MGGPRVVAAAERKQSEGQEQNSKCIGHGMGSVWLFVDMIATSGGPSGKSSGEFCCCVIPAVRRVEPAFALQVRMNRGRGVFSKWPGQKSRAHKRSHYRNGQQCLNPASVGGVTNLKEGAREGCGAGKCALFPLFRTLRGCARGWWEVWAQTSCRPSNGSPFGGPQNTPHLRACEGAPPPQTAGGT